MYSYVLRIQRSNDLGHALVFKTINIDMLMKTCLTVKAIF